MHHLHGLSIAEIGQLIDRTPAAVAGLLKRGLRALSCSSNRKHSYVRRRI